MEVKSRNRTMDRNGTSDWPDWAAQLAAAQAWWREAGIDMAFADEPREWLTKPPASVAIAEPAVRETPPKPAPLRAPRIGGDRARWPETLAAFADWWLTEPTLDPEPAAPRVLPAGPEGAALMVLVAMPEPEDRERLLSGRQGRLLDAMLTSFGIPRSDAYLASVLPRSTPLPDWPALASAGLGEVLAHHIALAAPQRLIVFGRDVSSLLAHDPAQPPGFSPAFNHERGSVPLAFAPSLEALLERPALKRGVWERWLEWTGT